MKTPSAKDFLRTNTLVTSTPTGKSSDRMINNKQTGTSVEGIIGNQADISMELSISDLNWTYDNGNWKMMI